MIRSWYAPAMGVLVVALHFGAIWSGFYDWQFSTRVFWFDNVLHALVGVGFAMGTYWLLQELGLTLSRSGKILAALGAAVVLALGWELVEYVFFTQFTEYAYWSRIYSPSLSEALSDVVSSLGGAVLFVAALWRKLA